MSHNYSAPVAVIGGTGRIGRLVVAGLIDAGRRVRIVARRVGSPLPSATTHAVDLADATALRPVLTGAAGVFLALPPTFSIGQIEGVADVIARSEVRRTVLLSSALVSAHPGTPMAIPHEQEERILNAALAESLVVLRPGMFMANDIIEWADSIHQRSTVVTAYPDALQLPIAPVDIAIEAVASLTDDARSSPRTLFGPQWLSARDRVAILEQVLDRSLTIQHVSPEYYRDWLTRLLPAAIAEQKVAMLALGPTARSNCPPLTQRGRQCYRDWATEKAGAFKAPS